MNNRRMNVLGFAVISTIAIGSLGFAGGCKSQEILKDRPCVPAPSNQEPANPAAVAPVVVTPIAAQPVLAPAAKVPTVNLAPAPVQTETVPK